MISNYLRYFPFWTNTQSRKLQHTLPQLCHHAAVYWHQTAKLIHPKDGISSQHRLSRTASPACISGHTWQSSMHLAGILPPATFCIINMTTTTSKEEPMFSLSECSLQRERHFWTESQEYCHSVQMFSCFTFIPIGSFL